MEIFSKFSIKNSRINFACETCNISAGKTKPSFPFSFNKFVQPTTKAHHEFINFEYLILFLSNITSASFC